MARIGFVACCKTKGDRPMPAAALYQSPLFRKSLLAALDASDKVYILSAKHGLVQCGEVIEPYDVTLKTMRREERADWGLRVAPQLQTVLRPRDTARMYCGEEYLDPLRPHLTALQVTVEAPLGSLSLGARLQALAALNEEAALRRMYADWRHLVRRLVMAQGGGRRFDESNGRQTWPTRGVYLILDAEGGSAAAGLPRVIRVGTHAVSQGSRTTLWDRLSTHRGTASGGGSHRSSIFRLHVGRAWTQHAPSPDWPSTWAAGQSAPREVRDGEAELEHQVSKVIGAMRVLWLEVPDEPGPASARAFLERNIIGLLSRIGLLDATSSKLWLGRKSADWRIATSGLWNLNYVFERPDPSFIERLRAAVSETIGRPVELPRAADAPSRDEQMDFFERSP